jgi:hypothetical protein
MHYLQAIHTLVLLLATVAVVVVVARVVADAWRGREAEGEQLAAVLLGRAIRRENERGREVEPALERRFTALQVKERTPSPERHELDLRLAPVYFVGAVLLQWVVGRLMGQSMSLWLMAGGALLATVAGICVAHLARLRWTRRARGDAAGYVVAALLAVMSALTHAGS